MGNNFLMMIIRDRMGKIQEKRKQNRKKKEKRKRKETKNNR